MLRFLTAGESHGPTQVAILEGIPAGLKLKTIDIQAELEKRRGGAGRSERGVIEQDKVKILSGIRFGETLGSPIALMVENVDFPNWKDIMSQEKGKTKPLTKPRPGHTDLAGVLKYNFADIRNVIERASARETVMKVAVGAICKKLLKVFNIEIASHTVQISNIKNQKSKRDFNKIKNVYLTDPTIRCLDKKTSRKMAKAILEATKNKDTLGGVVEAIAHHVPPGLGSYVHFDRKIDGQLAQVLMSIPSVKAVEIGQGIKIATKLGSLVHDEIFFSQGKYFRKTNRAGGIEGGITNGEDVVCRVYHKPLSTLSQPLRTVDISTKRETPALLERSDVCVVARASVITEAMVAFVLAKAMIEKFGGDSIGEMKRNFKGYIKKI